MDVLKALAKIDEFLEIVELNFTAWNSGQHDVRQVLDDQLIALLPGIEEIARAAEPDRHHQYTRGFRGWTWHLIREETIRLKGLLQQRDEIAKIVGPQGPQLAATRLHPWVWEAATSLWDDGHRREAIQAAATQVDIHLAAKISRSDLSGTELVQRAFSLNAPTLTEKRLRLPGFEPDSQTYRDAHLGAMRFGEGCFLAIRNVATHQLDQPDEPIALELLAALSVLARWIDSAAVVGADQGP